MNTERTRNDPPGEKICGTSVIATAPYQRLDAPGSMQYETSIIAAEGTKYYELTPSSLGKLKTQLPIRKIQTVTSFKKKKSKVVTSQQNDDSVRSLPSTAEVQSRYCMDDEQRESSVIALPIVKCELMDATYLSVPNDQETHNDPAISFHNKKSAIVSSKELSTKPLKISGNEIKSISGKVTTQQQKGQSKSTIMGTLKTILKCLPMHR